MKGNKKQQTDMQNLAETGWKQMHEMLREHGLSNEAVVLPASFKRRNLFLFIAACTFFILIFSYPFILNDHSFLSSNQKNKTENSSVNESANAVKTENDVAKKNISSSSGITSQQKLFLHQKINAHFSQFQKEIFISGLQFQRASLLKKLDLEKNCRATIPPTDHFIDTTIEIRPTNILQKRSSPPDSKKIRVFAGAGVNISTGKDPFDFDNVNIHPGITLIVPVTNKLSLHTGVWALSTIHGKEASTKEKEITNSFNPNVYYNINTTSVIKASYFDVPITLHYSINKKWSVGTGLQLSKLYKVNIKEQKESFDYNNTLYSASVQQYNATPTRAAFAFQKKLEIKKFETRLVAETNFETGKFLLSAGYYYGLGKTISLKDAVNSDHQYRNVYFKLGIQYRIH
jgi:hypothetical protein